MPASELSALLMLLTATSFTPGPNTALSTALAANRGLRHAMPFVLSVPVGWGLMLCFCAAGVGALVEAQPALRNSIQALGVSYLLWLAFKLARSGSPASGEVEQLHVTFVQGVVLQFVNIKAWMLALTLVSGWLVGRANDGARLGLLLPAMVGFGFASNLAYALVGSMLREWLDGPAHQGLRRGWFNRGMAVILVATAAWMARF
jgi:threonine/homoserine/homoserine lactone efflux protein